MKFTYAIDDDDWRKRIALKYVNCVWPGCSSNFGLGGHHIIPRGFKELRLVLENGILLCTEHHGKVEEIKGTKAYDSAMIILAGKNTYQLLKDTHENYLRSISMINSEDELISEVTI